MVKQHIHIRAIDGWYCRCFIHNGKLLVLNRVAPVGHLIRT